MAIKSFARYCNGFPPYFNKQKNKNVVKFKRIAASFAKNATILN